MSKELFIAILITVYLVAFFVLGHFQYQKYKARKIITKMLDKARRLIDKQEEINELNRILIDPDYAKSLGIKVYVKVEEGGGKYAILNNGEEEVRVKLNK